MIMHFIYHKRLKKSCMNLYTLGKGSKKITEESVTFSALGGHTP